MPAANSKNKRATAFALVAVVLALCACAIVLAASLLRVQAQFVQAEVAVAAQADPVPSKEEAQEAPRGEALSEVVDLSALFGMTLDQAVDEIGRGAAVQSVIPMNSEEYSTQATILLVDEPGNSNAGTPQVTLRFDAAGLVCWAAYEAPLGNLGYRDISFEDAVSRLGVIQDALKAAGLRGVEPERLALPEDRSTYCTYADDRTTLQREQCAFSGTGTFDGQPASWSATLTFDYRLATKSGNLADTLRTLQVSISR